MITSQLPEVITFYPSRLTQKRITLMFVSLKKKRECHVPPLHVCFTVVPANRSSLPNTATTKCCWQIHPGGKKKKKKKNICAWSGGKGLRVAKGGKSDDVDSSAVTDVKRNCPTPPPRVQGNKARFNGSRQHLIVKSDVLHGTCSVFASSASPWPR